MAVDFSNRSNLEYMEEIQKQYLIDPDSVDKSWHYYFQGMEIGREKCMSCIGSRFDTRIFQLIRSYRKWGHLNAEIDPLGIQPRMNQNLRLENFGFTEEDLGFIFPTLGVLPHERDTLRNIVDALETIYCRTLGADYVDGANILTEAWFQGKFEPNLNQPQLTIDEKRDILQALSEAELFERFLHTKYVGQKRFSIEGGDALIPCLREMIEALSVFEAEEVIFGMPHRGRLNVLANIMHKTYEEIFHEFEPNYSSEQVEGDGDVKYHKGFMSEYSTRTGKQMYITLVDNPSHLEVVGPLVEGLTHANQTMRKGFDKKKVVPVLIHGDASFAGQGVVSEMLNMSKLQGYETGGTIHIVVNNQIGFTTDPKDSRSTTYCTDVARHISAPVFHVNGDDVEMLVHAIRIACEFRQLFHIDVVIDLVCFRRQGHNEGDEPSFTQPLMYQAIKKHPSSRRQYLDQLVQAGKLEKALAKEMEKDFQIKLQEALELAKSENWMAKRKPDPEHYNSYWKKTPSEEMFRPVATQISVETIHELARKITTFPESFTPHPKVKKLFEQRFEQVKDNRIDWGMGELFAYGSLMLQGIPCRLSGQDVKRGTFSHRHAAVFDYTNGQEFLPLNHMTANQEKIYVHNSLLSEMAVLGFEFGFSLAKPQCLVIWEAQFGDFANGAQVVVDQFISSSESKWNRVSDLVMFLPHGFEGQGPEHSSAKLERYLQLCAENNMQVANLTTPAQLFHILRRQMFRDFLKPLVIMTPKSLLRHPRCTSTLDDFTCSGFSEVIDDPEADPDKAKRILFCSGKVYYDLLEEKENSLQQETAIVRIEQLYPFAHHKVEELKNKYAKAKEIVWIQEEPRNMGAWSYVRDHFEKVFEDRVVYIGRKASASPAVGSMKLHLEEQKSIIKAAFSSLESGVIAL